MIADRNVWPTARGWPFGPGREAHVVADLPGGDSRAVGVSDEQRHPPVRGDERQAGQGGPRRGSSDHAVRAVRTEATDGVGIDDSRRNPAAPSSSSYFANGRSRPPVITSMFRSSSPPPGTLSDKSISTT